MRTQYIHLAYANRIHPIPRPPAATAPAATALSRHAVPTLQEQCSELSGVALDRGTLRGLPPNADDEMSNVGNKDGGDAAWARSHHALAPCDVHTVYVSVKPVKLSVGYAGSIHPIPRPWPASPGLMLNCTCNVPCMPSLHSPHICPGVQSFHITTTQ
jgi:hypothetical protein